MVEKIILCGSVTAAITTILTAIIAIYRPVKKAANSLKMLEEHTKENHLEILRLTYVSTEMPTSERLIAGQKYVDMGGNGEIKAKFLAEAAAFGEDYVKQLKKQSKGK